MRAKKSKPSFNIIDGVIVGGLIVAFVVVAKSLSRPEAEKIIRGYSVTDPKGYTDDFVKKWAKAIQTGNILFGYNGETYSSYSATKI